jgi:hypothetical protein
MPDPASAKSETSRRSAAPDRATASSASAEFASDLGVNSISCGGEIAEYVESNQKTAFRQRCAGCAAVARKKGKNAESTSRSHENVRMSTAKDHGDSNAEI